MTATVDTTLARSKILEDTVVSARAPWSGWVRTGQVLRLIDLEGQQDDNFAGGGNLHEFRIGLELDVGHCHPQDRLPGRFQIFNDAFQDSLDHPNLDRG